MLRIINAVIIDKMEVEAYGSVDIQIRIKEKKNIVLGVAYRSKQCQVYSDMTYKEIKVITRLQDSVIVDDFNNPGVNWDFNR